MDGIQGQYATGATRAQVARALAATGKSPDALIAADLAPLEDLHLLGRLATAALAMVTADTLRDTICAAGFEVRDWTDRTEFSIEPMRAFLAAPRGELGLHVFVPPLR